jgi:uncharacterized protein
MVGAFSPRCREQIGYYVYALLDTREHDFLKSVFYIGKGVGDRCHQHARAALKNDEAGGEKLKLDRILDIWNTTRKPPHIKIIAHDLSSDEEAFRLEALLIAVLPSLTNAIKGIGHRDYWLSDSELDARYANPLRRSALPGNILLVSLNGKKGAVGKRDMSPYPLIKDDPAKLSDRTLGAWPVSPEKAKTVDYVIGVYRGLTRCVFKIAKQKNGDALFSTLSPRKPHGKRRVIFVGELIEKVEWTLRTIVDRSKTVTKFNPQSACRMLPATRRSTSRSLSSTAHKQANRKPRNPSRGPALGR